MITFYDKLSFLDSGLGFTDYFEEKIFEFHIKRDGFMFYDPVSKFMYDKDGFKQFYVEQIYIVKKQQIR